MEVDSVLPAAQRRPPAPAAHRIGAGCMQAASRRLPAWLRGSRGARPSPGRRRWTSRSWQPRSRPGAGEWPRRPGCRHVVHDPADRDHPPFRGTSARW